jgi:hypothetical protein
MVTQRMRSLCQSIFGRTPFDTPEDGLTKTLRLITYSIFPVKKALGLEVFGTSFVGNL